MKRILCFGEILWDAFRDEKVAGGAPMNVARHLAQQGADVSFASRIGTDESGKGLITFLKQSNLYTNLIQLDNELPTCEVTVQLDEQGHATYVFPPVVSWDNIQIEQPLVEAFEQASAIVYGSLACRMETTRNTLTTLLGKSKALRIFDVNLRPPHYALYTVQKLAAGANVVKMNDDEAALLIDDPGSLEDKIMAFQKANGAQTVCVTRGANGAIAWHNNRFFEHPGIKVNVVDTVGAGDSFLATFVSGLLADQPMEKVLEKACYIGAFVAGKRGANPVYGEEQMQVLQY